MISVHDEASLSPQKRKTAKVRKKVIESTINCLYNRGYADTSINIVVAEAKISKGALQYHFSTKEDLISETVNYLLSRSLPQPKPSNRVSSLESTIISIWKNLINTPAYFALMEILVASRTDAKLHARISDNLIAWETNVDERLVRSLKASSGEDEEILMLMDMTRSFMRGLLFQRQFGASNVKVMR